MVNTNNIFIFFFEKAIYKTVLRFHLVGTHWNWLRDTVLGVKWTKELNIWTNVAVYDRPLNPLEWWCRTDT